MSFLKHSSRAIKAYHQHSMYSSNRYPFFIRSSLYSTSYQLNAPQITKTPRARKIREPSSSSSTSTSPSPSLSSPKIKHEAAVIDWRPPARPDEIPYQAKDANLVNLIGHIKLPLMWERWEDDRYRTITFISQEFGENVFCIPIMFEDDLADVASFHLKLGDFVHVKGRLSEDPIPVDLSQIPLRSNYHVVVQDIKFVAGFRKKTIEGDVFPDGVDDRVLPRNDALNYFGDNQFGISAVRDRLKETVVDSPKSSRTTNEGKSEECIIDTSKGFHTKKDRESDSDSWHDLVKNSKQWLDFRDLKSKGSLTPKFPDFKHKDVGTALWLTSAPKWVLTTLGNLEFCVNVPKKNTGSKQHGKDEVWKSFVENPSLWWDNRLVKKNVKGPDFIHKETREALWLNSAPDWAASKLPPLRQKQSADAL